MEKLMKPITHLGLAVLALGGLSACGRRIQIGDIVTPKGQNIEGFNRTPGYGLTNTYEGEPKPIVVIPDGCQAAVISDGHGGKEGRVLAIRANCCSPVNKDYGTDSEFHQNPAGQIPCEVQVRANEVRLVK